jgi:succinate dehydrogenase/fumarate reductase flavoprotein subunit
MNCVKINTDVLVVGGGLAGLCAALEARLAGREVLLACKRKAGRSGNTLLAACNISGVFDHADDSVHRFARDVVQGGGGISDPELVRTLAEGSSGLITFLERFGVRFLREEGKLIKKLNPGHSLARTVTTARAQIPVQTAGLSLMLPLLRNARESGVCIMDDLMVSDLLTGPQGVRGAEALARDGRRVYIKSRSVVLACGGGGRLFANSNNTREMTGDGLALAYRAGAELRDLEFIQFHPTMGMMPVSVILPTTLFGDGAVLRNRAGDRFLLHEYSGGEVSVTRDAMSRAICREVLEGRGIGSGVYLDLTGVSSGAAAGRYRDLWELLRRRGCRPERDFLTVGIAVHFFMGGMTIDASGASTVPGLFGAGEVTGGVHGTNRLGGNALAEAVVFGRIAGKSAASHACDKRLPDIAPLECSNALSPPGRVEELSLLRSELKSLMWKHAGVIRSGRSLEAGIQNLQELERRLRGFNGAGGVEGLELKNMLLAAQLILLAALSRTESRGSHFRSDFSSQDETLGRGSLRIRRRAEGPQIVFEPDQAPPS